MESAIDTGQKTNMGSPLGTIQDANSTYLPVDYQELETKAMASMVRSLLSLPDDALIEFIDYDKGVLKVRATFTAKMDYISLSFKI